MSSVTASAWASCLFDRLIILWVSCHSQKWGIECTRFEIQDFRPSNREVEKQLELQMQAERERRKQILDTQALVNVAEGHKQRAILESEASQLLTLYTVKSFYPLTQVFSPNWMRLLELSRSQFLNLKEIVKQLEMMVKLWQPKLMSLQRLYLDQGLSKKSIDWKRLKPFWRAVGWINYDRSQLVQEIRHISLARRRDRHGQVRFGSGSGPFPLNSNLNQEFGSRIFWTLNWTNWTSSKCFGSGSVRVQTGSPPHHLFGLKDGSRRLNCLL